MHLSAAVVNLWGDYAAAIARWEHAIGRPALAPTAAHDDGP